MTFHNNYIANPAFPQTGDVDVSTDGGSTWTNVWHHGGDAVPGPDLETAQLPDAANQSNVKLRFHFTSVFGFWWMIDDVTVHSGACDAVPGGLVEGNVSDLSTGNAINGATVQSNDVPTDSTKTFAVPDDPNNPGGFYFLFSSVTGSHPFTASASLHSPDTETVNVAGDNTVRQDFKLGSTPRDHTELGVEHAGARLHGDQDADVPQRRHRGGAREAERAGRRVPDPGHSGGAAVEHQAS